MILTLILVFIAGFAKACADTCMSDGRWADSVFNNGKKFFLNVNQSWRNKYKPTPFRPVEPAFFGSTTFLVMFTDGWHLSQMVYNKCLIIAILCYAPITPYYIADFLLLVTVFHGSFVLFYNKLLLKWQNTTSARY